MYKFYVLYSSDFIHVVVLYRLTFEIPKEFINGYPNRESSMVHCHISLCNCNIEIDFSTNHTSKGRALSSAAIFLFCVSK